MSLPPASVALPRPGFIDYLLLFVGLTFSAFLAALSGLQAPLASTQPGPFALALAQVTPFLIFLPTGVSLLWPAFFTTQRLAGRSQGLSLGEWQWGLAFLVNLFLVVWVLWKASGSAPEALTGESFKPKLFAVYVIYLIAMGLVGLGISICTLFTSAPQPWTHSFALALMLWPLLGLGLIKVAGVRLEFI